MESRRQPRLSATAPCVSANPKHRPLSSSVELVARFLWGEEAARLAQNCLFYSASKRSHRCYWVQSVP